MSTVPTQEAAQTAAGGIAKLVMPSPLGNSVRPVGSINESYFMLESKQAHALETSVPTASDAVLEHLKQGGGILQHHWHPCYFLSSVQILFSSCFYHGLMLLQLLVHSYCGCGAAVDVARTAAVVCVAHELLYDTPPNAAAQYST